MASLIEHGTWSIIPLVLAGAFLLFHVAPRLYPRLLARYDATRDGGRPEPPAE
jgi:hypothetical protein